MAIQEFSELTPREREQMDYDEKRWLQQSEHQVEMKKLDIELEKLEAKWSAWLRLPKYIILWPVYILAGFALIVTMARKHDPGINFWRLFK